MIYSGFFFGIGYPSIWKISEEVFGACFLPAACGESSLP